MVMANLFPTHLLILDSGLVAMKAKITMVVLANMQETATEKMRPKVICRRRQVTLLGLPMKSRAQRKESRRDIRSAKVRSLLLALTMGVCQYLMKTLSTKNVITDKE